MLCRTHSCGPSEHLTHSRVMSRAPGFWPSCATLPIPPWLLVSGGETAFSEERNLGNNAETVSQEPSPEASVIAQQGQQLLLNALTKLSPIHRDILVLREMEGLSYAEISQITGTAIGTVMSRLSRARAELQRSVRSQCREPMDKSRAVLKGRQIPTRGIDLKAHHRQHCACPAAVVLIDECQ